MRVRRDAPAEFTAEFESEQEVRDEHRLNLSFGALRLPTTETVGHDALLNITLRGPWGGEAFVTGRAVAALPGGIALALDGDPTPWLVALLARPQDPGGDSPVASAPVGAADDGEEQAAGRTQWDRVRGLSQMEKILLAAKADRSERALLLADHDPRVLLSILRNPRLTVEEVARVARSSYLTYQIADTILQTAQWTTSLDVRLGLVNNPRTPQAFALRLLPTLPESEVRAIARGGTSMALKQAALRRLQDKP